MTKIPNVIENKKTVKFSDQVWNDIKDIDIQAFSMPNQFLRQWVVPIPNLDQNVLTLFIKTQAIINIVENLFRKNDKYKLQAQRQYVYNGSTGVAIDIVSTNEDINLPIAMEDNETWIELSRLDLALYGMGNQFVSKYFLPLYTNKDSTLLIYTDNKLAANSLVSMLSNTFSIISNKPFTHKQKLGTLLEIRKNK
jgi:hypothetical protein